MRNELHHFDRLRASRFDWLLPRTLAAALITVYQRTLSPDHGPLRALFPYGYCRQEPTCSAYAKKVITEGGVLIGLPLLCWRLLTCHPWGKTSHDKLLALSHRVHSSSQT